MPAVVPVKFSFSVRDLWFSPAEVEVHEGDHVICQTARGTEIGLATSDPFEVPEEEIMSSTDDTPLSDVVRVATEEDLSRAEQLAENGDKALPVFRKLVEDSELDMKPVGVEYLFGGEKVVCYFAAEERQDFRQLVRDLSHELHEKIDMRQIGVREESAIVGGYAHCGQELCCARFGNKFDPVSIRMAKEQDLPLNSTKISGVCGRLMCCLRYEFETYRDFKSRAPKKNAVIETPLGKAKIVEYDTPKEELVLRVESGKQMRIPLADMTTSEAAVAKAAELNCPCRPDTVERSVLERLESVEIQMALADLDREMGVIEEEDFDSSDIFVEPKRKRRNRSANKDQDSQQNEGNKQDNQSSQTNNRKRRRRSNAGSNTTGEQQESAPTQKRTRRRHHASSESGANNQASTSQSSEHNANTTTGTRRRRRPGDRGGVQANSQGAQGSSNNANEGQSQGRRRRRRRSSE